MDKIVCVAQNIRRTSGKRSTTFTTDNNQKKKKTIKHHVNFSPHSVRLAQAVDAKIRIRQTVHGVHRRSNRMRNHRPNHLGTWKRPTEPWPPTKVNRCWLARMAVARLTYQLCHDRINWKCRVARKHAPPICKWKFHQTRNTEVSRWPDQQPLNSVSRFVNAFPMVRTACRNRVPI